MQNWVREKKASKSFERPRDAPIMPTEAQAVPAAEKWVQVSERGAVPQGKNDMVTEMSQPKKNIYISKSLLFTLLELLHCLVLLGGRWRIWE